MMHCKNNHRNQYIALIGIILMILARGFLPTSSLLLLIAFCFFCCTLFLGGYGVSRFFALENTNEMYAFSIGFGYIIQLLAFFIGGIFNNNIVNYCVVIGFAAWGFYCFVSDVKEKKMPSLLPNTYVLILWSLLLLVTFMGMSLKGMLPVKYGTTEIYADVLWNIGNENSLKMSFPNAMDIRFLDAPFNYHFFSMAFKAQLSRICNMRTTTSFLVFSSAISTAFLCFSVASLAQRFLKSEKKAALAPFLTSFVTSGSIVLQWGGAEACAFSNNSIQHLFYTPNGLDYAVPLLSLCVLMYLKIFASSNIRILQYIMFGVATACLTGTKGPAGLMLIGTCTGMVIIALLKKQRIKPAFFLCVISILFFGIIYFWLLSSNSDGVVYVKPFASLYSTGFWKSLCYPLLLKVQQVCPQVVNLMHYPAVILFSFLFCLGFSCFSGILCIFQLYQDLKRFSCSNIEHFVLYGLISCGFFPLMIFSVDGESQFYFGLLTLSFMHIIALIWLVNYWKILHKGVKTVIALLLVIALLSGLDAHKEWCMSGVRNAYNQIKEKDTAPHSSAWQLTTQEYQALEWIRDNTPVDSVIATDRHYCAPIEEITVPPRPNDNSRYFYYSAISERQMYIEGWAFTSRTDHMRKLINERLQVNDMIYNPSTQNREKLLREHDINYVIVSEFIHPNFELDELNLVFENDSMRVYSISDS